MFPVAFVQAVVWLIAVGLLLWLVQILPIDAAIKQIIRVIVVVVIVIWLIYLLLGLSVHGPLLR